MMDFRRWLEDSQSDAEEYFSIGHGDYSDEHGIEPKFIVWVLISGEIHKSEEYDADSARTHGSLWGHDMCDRTFKGRYEPETGRISIVKPCRQFTRFKDPDQYLKYELIPILNKEFGKLKPQNIFVF
jgi:hypothetical protein